MKTILIADDDWDLADALALRIKRLGFKTITVHDALTTMKTVHEVMPDLLIVDVQMPDGDGLSICDAMAADTDLAHIPILTITGRQDVETVTRCRLSHAHYVLKSPTAWPEIERYIFRLLQQQPASAPPGGR